LCCENKSLSESFFLQTGLALGSTLSPQYHPYIVERDGKTLLPQFLGMYRLTVDNVENYMCVMRNVFSGHLKVPLIPPSVTNFLPAGAQEVRPEGLHCGQRRQREGEAEEGSDTEG
jgi:hypothetical protein